jgi:hypothetical protein
VLRTFPGYEPPPPEEPVSESSPPTAASLRALRHTNPDGSVTLSLRSPAEVMYQVMTTLQHQEHDLLLEQVIAERAKREYLRRGRDPGEAVDFLVKHKEDVAALFATFPMADQTPGVHLETVGRNAFRLRAPVAMAGELRLHSFDVVIEEGRFRLLMIR